MKRFTLSALGCLLMLPGAPALRAQHLGAVVCIASQRETVAGSGPVQRVISTDTRVVYEVGVSLSDQAQVEEALQSELGSAQVRCVRSAREHSHVVVVSYQGVVRRDLTIDPDDPRFQRFSVGYGASWEEAESDATDGDGFFASNHDGRGYQLLVRETWRAAGSTAVGARDRPGGQMARTEEEPAGDEGVFSIRSDSFAVEGGVMERPLVLEDGTVVLGTMGKTVHFIRSVTEDRRMSQRHSLGEPVYGSPSLVTIGGAAMVAIPTFSLVSFFDLDGTRRGLPYPLSSNGDPIADEVVSTEKGTLLLGTQTEGLYFVSYDQGLGALASKQFKVTDTLSVTHPPLLAKDSLGQEVIVAGGGTSGTGYLFVLDEDADLIRRVHMNAPTLSAPRMTKRGHIAVGLDDGRVVVYTLEGEKVSEFETEGAKRREDNWTVGWADGTNSDFSRGVSSSPAFLDDGTMVFGALDGRAYFVDPLTGEEKSSFQTRGMIFSSPALMSDGTVVVGSSDGKVYFFGPDGSLRAEFEREGFSFSSPAIMKTNGRELVVIGALLQDNVYYLELIRGSMD